MPKDTNTPPSLYLEKPLPASVEAEQISLGAVLVDNDIAVELIEHLEASDYYVPRHRRIFAAIVELFKTSNSINAITVAEQLKKQGQLDSIGGITAITNLMHGVPHFSNISEYTKVIKDKSIIRQLVKQCSEIQTAALSEEHQSQELLDRAEHLLYSLRQNEKSKAVIVSDAVVNRMIELKEIQKNNKSILGLSTGYSMFDTMLSGIQPKKNIIIAARPSMGKSALALNIADGITKNNPEAVAIYFSLEMSEQELTDRLICGKAGIDTNDFALGRIPAHKSEAVKQAIVELDQQKLYIVDSSQMTILDIKAHIRKVAKIEKRIDVVITDHIGLMASDKTIKYEGRRESISNNARGFKPIAKEFNCTTIELSQLNRTCEARNPPRPMLSDLRETGDLEQEADTVIMIYREEYYTPTTDNQGKSEILITKNRGGATGSFDMTFRKEFTRFENYYG